MTQTHRYNTAICLALTGLLSLTACAKPLDMSGEKLTPVGPEWGVVIGSVLVRPVKFADESGKSADAAGMTYEFDIVQSQPGDPEGERPYAPRYRLESKAGEERLFISRLRPGTYLLRGFAQDRIAGKGGDLDLEFDCVAGEVRYLGRLLVEIPQRVSRGKEFRFAVENAGEATLKNVAGTHPELARQAIDGPMRTRE